ncbi:MAG: formylglycine-generating enzyme family protein, partial [Gammaproteobacteria bacterium]
RGMSLLTRTIVAVATLMLLGGCAGAPTQQFAPLQTFRDAMQDGFPGPAMVVVPAGRFMMGPTPEEPLQLPSEVPRHAVTFEEPFAISQYEITFEEFDRFVAATGYRKPSDKGWGPRHWGRTKTPVFNVSWHDAQRYVEWLSEQTGEYYQLPSEAQWEYAARAGTDTAFHTGKCINTSQANFHGNYNYGNCPTTNVYRGKTMPVGSFSPNAWGLYDVHGNIFEWTRDCWHSNYEGAPTDGNAWMNVGDNVDCELRVLRGGSWSGRPQDIRSAARSRNDADFKSIFIGFRVVRTIR